MSLGNKQLSLLSICISLLVLYKVGFLFSLQGYWTISKHLSLILILTLSLILTITLTLFFPLPFSSATIEIWRVLAQDKQLATSILDYLLDSMGRSLPYEEKPGSHDGNDVIRTATLGPVIVSLSLLVLLQIMGL
jgi:hypothetical protein